MQSIGVLMNSSPRLDNNDRISISEGNAPYVINAELIHVGDDLLCIITGGTHAHIGAVTLAEPAVSFHPVTGEKQGEGSEPVVRTLTGQGHKDALPAEMFAKALCQKYNVNVVCTSGIHVDDATKEDIEIMMKNVNGLLDRLLEARI